MEGLSGRRCRSTFRATNSSFLTGGNLDFRASFGLGRFRSDNAFLNSKKASFCSSHHDAVSIKNQKYSACSCVLSTRLSAKAVDKCERPATCGPGPLPSFLTSVWEFPRTATMLPLVRAMQRSFGRPFHPETGLRAGARPRLWPEKINACVDGECPGSERASA